MDPEPLRAEPSPDQPPAALPIVHAGLAFQPPDLPRTAQLFVPTQAFPNWWFLNPAFPVWEGRALILPVPGFYFFKDGARTRVYLAASSWPALNADIAFSFTAGASNGCHEDFDEFMVNPEAYCLGLFRRWHPVRLNCGPSSWLLGHILTELGLNSRVALWAGPSGTHRSVEVDLPTHGWTLYDPHFGLAYRPGVTGFDVFRRSAESTLSAELTCCFPKHHWLEEAWHAYRSYTHAFGILEPDGVSACVTCAPGFPRPADRHAALVGLSGAMETLDPRSFERRYYGGPAGIASCAALATAV